MHYEALVLRTIGSAGLSAVQHQLGAVHLMSESTCWAMGVWRDGGTSDGDTRQCWV